MRSITFAALTGGLSSLALAVYTFAPTASAQPAPPNGPRDVQPGWHAIVHATLVPRPGEKVEDATIVIRNGVIVSAGAKGEAPKGARVWDYTGLTVYPGFIDAHVPVDAPAPDPKAPGAHWNAKVTPQRTALDGGGLDDKARKSLRDMGFTVAAIAPKGGVFRGAGSVVSLADAPAESEAGEQAIVARAFHEVSFETGGFGGDSYPSSQMGAIALLRQTLSDADWRVQDLASWKAAPTSRARPMPADALDALARREGPAGDLPLLFDTSDELEILRAGKIAREFNRPFLVLGSGTEFQRLGAVAGEKVAMIIPLVVPETPKVETQADAESVDLRDLMTWEQAPTNLRRLDAAGATVALTTDKLKKKEDFRKNLREAIRHGLSEEKALAMLTTNPAKILGVEKRVGEVAPGLAANLVATEGSYFGKELKMRDVWVDGQRYEVSAAPKIKPEGKWEVSFAAPLDFKGVLAIEKGNKVTFKAMEKEQKARGVKSQENRLSMLIDNDPWGAKGAWALTGVLEGEEMIGTGVSHEGQTFAWTAKRVLDEKGLKDELKKEADAKKAAEKEKKGEAKPGEADKKDDVAGDKPAADKPDALAKNDDKADGEKKDAKAEGDEEKDDRPAPDAPEKLGLPFGPYAYDEYPAQEEVFVVNATVWTSGPAGIIENGGVHVKDGRIVAVGKDVKAPASPGAGVRVIDAKGKHVTPGLIDCHSHTGISRGVNEGSQAITAEVRIQDVIDPDSINWYRELAGGLTGANQLHGSANPMGGQNSVVKIRWGVEKPDDLRNDAAPPGIKFALGENVKQSNWGDRATTRYPQTRMGVETLMRDAFAGARDYAVALDRWNALSAEQKKSAEPVRRDLEAECLAEILQGKRLIHCHSYRQDEILMLCRLAKDFGFGIGTFQHVLEGYKVADAIKEVARGGSTFSDWWAYKMEVMDAIPENGAIMHEVGVAVSFNSDSDELARRLNTEAAKAVKYGGVDRAEALKFVTLNPAKQLAIDGRVGSLEAKKDADFVIWSGDPLSAYTICESTWVDGREMFSLEKDKALRAKNASERRRIIQKVLADAKGKKDDAGPGGGPPEGMRGRGGRPGGPAPTAEELEHERLMDLLAERNLNLLKSGLDPDSHKCGECGVFDLGDH